MSTPFPSLLSLSVAALLLTTGCAGTAAEKDAAATNTATAMPTAEAAPPLETTTPAATPAPAPTPDAMAAGTTPATDSPEGMKAASTLLSANDVSGLFGRKVTATSAGTNSVSFMDPAAGGATVATLMYAPASAYDDVKAAGGAQITKVPGLGQGAYFDAGKGMLYVKSGDQTVQVSVPADVKGRDRRSLALNLGRMALARM